MQAQRTGKSSLLLSFKKEDSSFLKKRSKKLLPMAAVPPRHDFGSGTG
jgi:hypothetical protein